MTLIKQRTWVSRQELIRTKETIHSHLGAKSSALIPFQAMLPALDKPKITRILWSRVFRAQLSEWGLKIGIRTRKDAYIVEVRDKKRWQEALSGLLPGSPNETLPDYEYEVPPNAPDLRHLIPEIDPHYFFPDYTEDLKSVIQHGSKVLLSGPAGSGKTSIVKQLAAQMRIPFLRINLNGETSVSDLLGSWKIKGQEMIYQYGPIPMALRAGHAWLCLDELDAALPAVLFAIQGLLEDGGSLHLTDTNEWITPHKDFRLVATANSVGKGDESGLYSGTQQLNESFLDRFHCVFQIDYLPEEQERQVILGKVKGIEKRTLDRMLKVATELRKALKDGLIYSSFSTRKLLAWGCKTVQLGNVNTAARYTVLNKLTQDDQRVVLEVLQRHGFGGSQ